MALQRVLDSENPTSALVFCRTRLEVDTLVESLNSHGYRAEPLHGGMQQRQRDGVMKRFRDSKSDLLVATDVAARGLDIQQLSHVLNYDVPSAPEAYVHRIGRTGRAGRAGMAITLVEPREHRLLRTIENLTKQRIEVCPLPTVADLRARRLELTRASLRERLLEGDLDDVRAVVQSLAEEFDVLDIAAAAVKLAHGTLGRPDDTQELDTVQPKAERGRQEGSATRPPGPARDRSDTVRLFIGAGREAGIRPADLVGAIANEARVSSSQLGSIEIERSVLVGGGAGGRGCRDLESHAADDASRPESGGPPGPGRGLSYPVFSRDSLPQASRQRAFSGPVRAGLPVAHLFPTNRRHSAGERFRVRRAQASATRSSVWSGWLNTMAWLLTADAVTSERPAKRHCDCLPSRSDELATAAGVEHACGAVRPPMATRRSSVLNAIASAVGTLKSAT